MVVVFFVNPLCVFKITFKIKRNEKTIILEIVRMSQDTQVQQKSEAVFICRFILLLKMTRNTVKTSL